MDKTVLSDSQCYFRLQLYCYYTSVQIDIDPGQVYISYHSSFGMVSINYKYAYTRSCTMLNFQETLLDLRL